LNKLKQTNYTYFDASRIFLYAIIMPQLFGLLFVVLVTSFANLFGATYEVALDNVFVKMLTLFLAQLAFVALFFVYQRVRNINWIKATKLLNKITIKQIVLLIVIALASLFLFSPLINMIDHLVSLTGYSASSELPINLKSVGGFFVGVIALAVLPAIFEEFIFRGMLYQGLQKKMGVKGAIILSALLFALMHTSIQQTAYQIILGAMFAYAFYLTGSLLAPIILHFCNNFIVLLLNLFTDTSTQMPPVFNTIGDYVQVLITTAVGAYIIWQLFVLLKKISKTPQQYASNEQENETQAVEDTELIKLQQKTVEFQANKLLIIGISIGVLLWLVDFISYL
jgi:membrane protease YdiL (CAAX protease family)